jgi:hypothetical protein
VKKKSRNRLEKRIREAKSQTVRQELARYGQRVSMNVHRIEVWRARWLSTRTPDGKMTLTPGEREWLLSLFMQPMINLDDKFFSDMAESIRLYKKHLKPDGGIEDNDPVRRKLSDFIWWICNPAPPKEEIAQHVGYTGDMRTFRAMLNELGVRWTKSKGGRPRNSE